jgi:hypothetical protein
MMVLGVFMLRAVLLMFLLTVTALAQEADTYLSDQASKPESTDGVARLLHYLPQDMPIPVFIPEPLLTQEPLSAREPSVKSCGGPLQPGRRPRLI